MDQSCHVTWDQRKIWYIYIYVYSPQSFKIRNEERIKTAAGNREDVKNINEKAQKKAKEKQKMQREKEEGRLKEEDKKKTADKDRDKSCEKRQNTNADEEMRKKLENDGEDVPSGKAVNVNNIFS